MTDGGWAVSPYARLYSLVLCKFRKDVEFIGGSRLYIHPSTNLVMRKSRIIIENGTLRLGIPNFYSKLEYDASRDNCRLYLVNSVIHTMGNVVFLPGCKIVAINGTLVVRDGAMIHAPTYIFVGKKVEIGERCLLARGITIMDTDWHKLAIADEKPKEQTKEVIIKDHCWIGQNAVILKGVTIGEGAVVGANSVVTRDVPPRTMVAGNPARVIKENVVWEP
jgi:acetyltransferase-like isoleucine patch superfamily enzyme